MRVTEEEVVIDLCAWLSCLKRHLEHSYHVKEKL